VGLIFFPEYSDADAHVKRFQNMKNTSLLMTFLIGRMRVVSFSKPYFKDMVGINRMKLLAFTGI